MFQLQILPVCQCQRYKMGILVFTGEKGGPIQGTIYNMLTFLKFCKNGDFPSKPRNPPLDSTLNGRRLLRRKNQGSHFLLGMHVNCDELKSY